MEFFPQEITNLFEKSFDHDNRCQITTKNCPKHFTFNFQINFLTKQFTYKSPIRRKCFDNPIRLVEIWLNTARHRKKNV